jgi:Mg-chelatase subunit ChlD
VSFLTPLYLIGGALVLLPVVLHLLRRDVAPPVPFTAVHLLRGTPVARTRRRHLRDLLLLATRVAALLLLAGSFARPYRAAVAAPAGTTVVAVDRSFSMGPPARMARARELAQQAIDGARGDRVVVVAFDDRAEVVSASGTVADAHAALASMQAGYGATVYAAALDKAADLLVDADGGRLVIVSDLQRSGFDQSGATLPDGIDLRVLDAGGATANLSVSSATIDHRRVIVTARNGGPAPRTAVLSVAADGRDLPARRLELQGNDTVDVAFEAPADVRAVRARLSGDAADGPTADDERYAVGESRSRPRMLIVSGAPGSKNGFYLSRALLAEGDEGPDFDVRSVSGVAFSAMSDADLHNDQAIALLSTRGLDRHAGERLRHFLQTGGGVFVAAAPDVDAAVLSVLFDWTPPLASDEVADAGVLAATDLRHPVLRPFAQVAANLGQITFDRAWRIDPGAGWQVAARFTNGDVALAERTGTRGRVLLLTSDVDRRWNDFPLHASFVAFAQETARYLSARAPVPATFLVADVPPGIAARPGFYEHDARTIAVNVDPRESRIERVTPQEFRSLVTRTAAQVRPQAARQAAEAERREHYWQYGLMLMLATLVVEAFVGARG